MTEAPSNKKRGRPSKNRKDIDVNALMPEVAEQDVEDTTLELVDFLMENISKADWCADQNGNPMVMLPVNDYQAADIVRLVMTPEVVRFERYGKIVHWWSFDGRKWTETEDIADLVHRATDCIVALYKGLRPSYDSEYAALVKLGAENLNESQAGIIAWIEKLRKYMSALEHDTPRVDKISELMHRKSAWLVTENDFDTDPFILNCQNCVIDLRTGKTREHDPNDMCKKMVGVDYNTRIDKTEWENHLLNLGCGRQDWVDFLKWAIGGSYFGKIVEKRIFFHKGKSDTLKSSTLEAIMNVLMDYTEVSSEKLVATYTGNGGGNTTETYKADLYGKRVCMIFELNEDFRLNSNFIKTSTGADPIKARRMYHDGFTFRSTATVHIATNDIPKWSTVDEAMTKRPIIIPWENTSVAIDETKKDYWLEDERAKQQILAWVVEGAVEYYQRFYRTKFQDSDIPDCCHIAKAREIESQDDLGRFLEDCEFEITKDANDMIVQKALYDTYLQWWQCDPLSPKNSRPIGKIKFFEAMEGRGLKRDITNKREVNGIKAGPKTSVFVGIKKIRSNDLYQDEQRSDLEVDEMSHAIKKTYIREFLKDCAIDSADEFEFQDDILERYDAWCHENDMEPLDYPITDIITNGMSLGWKVRPKRDQNGRKILTGIELKKIVKMKGE